MGDAAGVAGRELGQGGRASRVPLRVLISYAHDDEAHKERVRDFWLFLRAHGIDARLDLLAAERRQDWAQWTAREVRDADRIVVVASPGYKRRAEGDAGPDEGRGVRWEAQLIRERLYAEQEAGLQLVLPVVLPGCSAGDLPLWLTPVSATHYVVTGYTVAGAEALLRVLTDQPRETEPAVGRVPYLPSRGPGSVARQVRPALRTEVAIEAWTCGDGQVPSAVCTVPTPSSASFHLFRASKRLTWSPHIELISVVLIGLGIIIAVMLYPSGGKPYARPASSLTDPGPNGSAQAMAFSPRDDTLATADSDGITYLWYLATHKLAAQLAAPGSNHDVAAVTFSPNGKIIATGDYSGGSFLWDVVSHRLITSLYNPNGQGVTSLAFSPDGNTLAVGDLNGYLFLWNVASHTLLRVLNVSSGSESISAVAFSPDGKTLAAATTDLALNVTGNYGYTELWRLPAYQPLGIVTDPDNPEGVWAMSFSPDGKLLATGDGNGTTYLWRIASYQLSATITDPGSSGVAAVAFSHDGKVLATGDSNGTTYLWRTSSYNLAISLPSPNGHTLSAIGFSPDDKILAIINDTRTANFWYVRRLDL